MSIKNNKKERDSKLYIGLCGILVGCEFTVLALILSLGDIFTLSSNSMGCYFNLSIFWLLISIFSFLETLTGFISFLHRKQENRYYFASFFYYLAMYAFYVSIIHLLNYQNLFFLAFVPYLFLFFNITFWFDHIIKYLKKIIKEYKEQKIRKLRIKIGFYIFLISFFALGAFLINLFYLGMVLFLHLPEFFIFPPIWFFVHIIVFSIGWGIILVYQYK
jgi:hypothetical protein